MKIDVHTHTKQCKSGDPSTRAITANEFCEIVQATDVRIIAITNHNHFDLRQYGEISNSIGGGIQVWPGIELDVTHDKVRGHLLVLVSPTVATEFSKAADKLIGGHTPDVFQATVEQVTSAFEEFEPVYVAHYKQKKPDLSDEAIEYLVERAGGPDRVLKEVTNAISAGIFISHGHSSIYGSDVQDWSKYDEMARELPELRLPVDSFEQFRLLLKKDTNAINTALSQKTSEELVLLPFDDVRRTPKIGPGAKL